MHQVRLALYPFILLLAGCVQVPSPGTRAGNSTVARPALTNATRSALRLATNSGPLRFVVTIPTNVRSAPITGRVLLFLSRTEGREPRFALDFFNLQPVFALDVTNLAPGASVTFSASRFRAPDALAFPGPLDRLEAGAYSAQVLVDLDPTARDFATGPGNLYSSVVKCQLGGASGGTTELVAGKVVPEAKPPRDTDRVKLVELRSKLLSNFHRRDITLRAGVVLPSTFHENTNATFPALYIIPGFGGRHTSAWSMDSSGDRRSSERARPLSMLRVVLDPDTPLGHSVFANSANNGPVGDALVQELIPEIERRFRAIPQAYGRFVTGHSSGGWASLWLQVAYPEVFGGCWSTAPDPVDFRAFQTIDIYSDRNGHWTREGYPRPVGRNREKVLLTFSQLNQWEYVTGYGGQLDSFDAVFSPRGPDGQPRRLMHKLTGAIDRDVAEHWKRYDIRRVLEENWSTLGPKLEGKLHVLAGGWDTFYLDGAVEYLRDFLRKADRRSYVEVHPGTHGSFLTDALRDRMQREIADQFNAGQKAFQQKP